MALSLTGLNVERRTNPLGLDAQHPRFAWRLVGDSQQAAYQLQVASDPAWSAIHWDTGRVASAASTYVPYGGPPLVSRQRYAWRVRVWDAAGAQSDWSPSGAFEMGLLAPADWSARWIAYVVPDLVSEPEELRRHQPSPVLRRQFDLPGAPAPPACTSRPWGCTRRTSTGFASGDERLAPGWTDYNVRLQYQTYDVTRLLRAVPMSLPSGSATVGTR